MKLSLQKLIGVTLTLVSIQALASPVGSQPVLTCTENSFSPNAAIYQVTRSGRSLTLTKALAGNSNQAVASEDVSDAKIGKSNDGYTFEIDRGRSGSATITATANGQGVVDISLYTASMNTLNTNGRLSDFRCVFFGN